MSAPAEVLAISDAPGLARNFLARLSSQQKLGLMLAVSAIAALLAGGWLWIQTPDYKVLFSNVSDADGGAIIASLQQMNVPYKFSEGSGTILVPAGQVHDARLRLATQGLPKGGLVGFELMEKQKFGTSQFLEQVNFQRALEGELARSIQSLAAVEGARVHLAMGKQSVFVREQQKPSASVLLNLYPGRVLDAAQVNAIVHLVSSSVPNLPVSHVTVVDQQGNLLSGTDDPETATGLNPHQLKYLHALEQSYARRIEAILAPIVGKESVRAQVAADVDFSHSERTDEIYKPNQDPGSSTVRSQQSLESATGGGEAEGGVPGALSNQPPMPATAPIETPPGSPLSQTPPADTAQPGGAAAGGAAAPAAAPQVPRNTRKDTTINYEVDKTIQHVRNPVGGIKRLSVAVVIDHRKVIDAEGRATRQPLSDAQKAEVTDLVKEAMGFNGERGDTLSVANSPFAVAEPDAAPEIPLWKQPEMIELAQQIGKNLLIASLILYLVLGVLRPLLRRTEPPARALLAEPSADGERSSGRQEPVPEPVLQLSQHEENLALARQMARDDPRTVARVIRQWVAGNG